MDMREGLLDERQPQAAAALSYPDFAAKFG
jgi:hypothetical protein